MNQKRERRKFDAALKIEMVRRMQERVAPGGPVAVIATRPWVARRPVQCLGGCVVGTRKPRCAGGRDRSHRGREGVGGSVAREIHRLVRRRRLAFLEVERHGSRVHGHLRISSNHCQHHGNRDLIALSGNRNQAPIGSGRKSGGVDCCVDKPRCGC